MPPPRPYWKGYLKLSLVSCPIALYTATSPGERVAFRQINKKTGNRLRQQLVDEGTGDPIDPDDKGRGYEVDKGVYLQVEDEELDAIVAAAISETGASGPAGMGQVMKVVTATVAGRAEGSRIAALVRSRLSS